MVVATVTFATGRLDAVPCPVRGDVPTAGTKRSKHGSALIGSDTRANTIATHVNDAVKKQKTNDAFHVLSTPSLGRSKTASTVLNVTPTEHSSNFSRSENSENKAKESSCEAGVVDLTSDDNQENEDCGKGNDQSAHREMNLQSVYDKFVELGLHKYTERYETTSSFTYRDFVKWLYEKNKKPNMSSLGWIMGASKKMKHCDAYLEFLASLFDYLIDFMRLYGEDIVHTRLIPHSKSFIALWKETGGYIANGWGAIRRESKSVSTLPIIDSATCTVKNVVNDLEQHKKDHPSLWRCDRWSFDEDHDLKNCSYFKNAIDIDCEMDPDTVTEQLELRGMKVKRVKAMTRCHRLAMVGQNDYEFLPAAWFDHDHKVGKRIIDDYLDTYDDSIQPFLKVAPLRAHMFVKAKRRIDLAYLECLVQAMIDFCVDEYEPLHLLYLKIVKGKDDPDDPTDIDEDDISSLGDWSDDDEY